MAWTMLFALIDFPVGTVPIRKISAEECSYTSPDKVEEALVRRALEGAEDLPIGVQVVGRPHQEEMCVRVMKELEWVHTLDVPPSVYK
jgi:Asp-tRNA(Asn)/Glu-tRNA(Gln) amidotransferase A subunit family amidase